MKIARALPFVGLASSFRILDEKTANELVLESDREQGSWFDKIFSKENVVKEVDSLYSRVVEKSENIFDDALTSAGEAFEDAKAQFICMKSMTRFDTRAWLDTAVENDPYDLEGSEDEHHPPHRPHKGHRGHKGRHGHHGHKTNLTIYELISKSNYTKILAKLVNEDEVLVKILNGTKANYTVFAPIDSAFEKLPKNHTEIPKELIRKVILYHVSPEFYPAGRVLVSHTAPSALIEKTLGDEPQRLRFGIGLNGLSVNFFSRIIAINIFAANGVIHGVDSVILPPPPALKILELFPTEFSTLQLGLLKTGLFEAIETNYHTGGTLFAPNNFAFSKLGPKINAFLFSKYGEKYLKALLEYHVVANQTLYSDAFYSPDSAIDESIPKGVFHVDLPTLLKDRSLSIDIARWGRFINIKINGFSSVQTQDGIAKDGVIHTVGSVLIPPKKLNGEVIEWTGEELEIEDLKERLGAFIDTAEIEEL